MRRHLLHWTVALAALVAAVGARWLLQPLIGGTLPLLTLFAAVAVAAWVGGWAPALVVAAVGYLACAYFFIEPPGLIWRGDAENLVALAAYTVTCLLIIGIGEALREARQRASEGEELLRVTLGSVGDAVIATDTVARVVYLNAAAEALTGWKLGDLLGRPLADVFPVAPIERAMRDRTVVALADGSVFLGKDKVERAIEGRAAPLRNEAGEMVGCVLTCRGISEPTGRRLPEMGQASQVR